MAEISILKIIKKNSNKTLQQTVKQEGLVTSKELTLTRFEEPPETGTHSTKTGIATKIQS